MATFHRYRVWCVTEGQFHEVVREEGEGAPSLCPVDGSHAIDPSKTAVVSIYTDVMQVDTSGNLKTSDKTPRDEEGKQIIQVYPASLSKKTFFTSRGDNLSPTPPDTGRGKGTQIRLVWDGTETFPSAKEVELRFSEVVEVHDGEASWKPVDNFSGEDEFSFDIEIPATVPTSTPGAGNVQEVDLGGGMKAYVPAAGDGSHTVDLEDWTASNAAIPVPGGGALATVSVWKMDATTGALSAWGAEAETPTEYDRVYAILNFAPPTASIVRNVSLGSPRGVFEIEAYRVEIGHPSWHYVIRVTKTQNSPGEFNGWLLIYRSSQV